MCVPKTTPYKLAFALCVAMFSYSCTYLKYTSVQSEYARIQKAEPGQVNVKHMLDRETFLFKVAVSIKPETTAKRRKLWPHIPVSSELMNVSIRCTSAVLESTTG